MATMRVTEETPTKMILELDPEYREFAAETYANSVKSGLGCLGFLAITVISVLFIAGYSFFTNSLRSLPWSFWVFAVVVLIAGALFVFSEVSFLSSRKNYAQEVKTTIDLDSQHAVRVEKLKSGKVNHYDLDLNQVRRILIHCEELGHSCRVLLDSPGSPGFEVNSDVFFDVEPMKAFGKKLGSILKKPVVLKMTDGGNLISEETIQTELRDDHRFDHLNLPRRRD